MSNKCKRVLKALLIVSTYLFGYCEDVFAVEETESHSIV